MTRKAYPTDLTDEEWEILKELLPDAKPGGRRRRVDLRDVLNAIFDRHRTGCAWARLPPDRLPCTTVYDYFNTWSKAGTWAWINPALVRRVRVAEGRNEEPSAAIIDSQSVKTVDKGANVATTRPSR
jgi:putative transposase